MTKKIIPCMLCELPATYTIQPDGGSIKYLCTKHFNKTVKQLEGAK